MNSLEIGVFLTNIGGRKMHIDQLIYVGEFLLTIIIVYKVFN